MSRRSAWVRGCSWAPTMSRCASSAGWSGSASSFPIRWMTSARKPSTPRSSQNRRTSCIASTTSGLAQLRSGCSARNRWRYHWPVASSRVQAGPPNAETQLFGGPSPRPSRHTYQSRFDESRDDLRLEEPPVLRARVVRHPVEQHAEPASMGFGEQPIEHAEIAEDRVDRLVIAHVVPEVGHRRAVDRREPDRVDAEAGDVVEPRADAGEVSDRRRRRSRRTSADRSGRRRPTATTPREAQRASVVPTGQVLVS